MTTLKEIASIIEAYAPLPYQEPYDNSGLQVGSWQSPICGALLCVDVTEQVLEEAIALGVNLIISHHPLLFHPLRQLTESNATERIVARALRSDVAIYAAHTNLDSTPQGLSYRLGESLGLEQMSTLVPHTAREGAEQGAGYGVIGTLAGEGELPLDFLRRVATALHLPAIRHSALCRERVSHVALSTGSGGSFIENAAAAEADIYLAADFKYNDFFTPDNRLIVADIGHFESECCAIDLLFDIIRKKIPTFALHKSALALNPVNYLV